MQKTKNPLIFLIEDSVVYKNLVVGYLKLKNYNNLKTFNTAEDCLKEINLKPDIIILDYSYGGISGLDLMHKVREENPAVDFIFLSGQNDVEVAVKLMKLGAADYVLKNENSPYRLVNAIEECALVTKNRKMKQGFSIGVIGFFIMLFLVIISIILITIIFNL